MPFRRSKRDIVISILEAVRDGYDEQAGIMERVDLSWLSGRDALDALVDHGLLVVMDSGRRRTEERYALTVKGREVLDYLEGSSELIKVKEKRANFKPN